MPDFTIVAVYVVDDMEIVVDFIEAENAIAAVDAFWSDEDTGKARRDECDIIALFEGRHKDMLPYEMGKRCKGPLSYKEWKKSSIPPAPPAATCPNDTDGDGNCGRSGCPKCRNKDRHEASAEEDEIPSNLINAITAANILNDWHCENMMATGQGFDFNVTYNVSTDRVALILGPFTLWDDEDENDGKFEIPDIVTYAQDEINALARSFDVVKKED